MGAQEDADELSDAKNEEIAASNQQQHQEKSLEAQETKLSSDRNTAKFARTQESFGEQEAFSCESQRVTSVPLSSWSRLRELLRPLKFLLK